LKPLSSSLHFFLRPVETFGEKSLSAVSSSPKYSFWWTVHGLASALSRIITSLVIFIFHFRFDNAAEFVGERCWSIVTVMPATIGFQVNGIGSSFVDGAKKIQRSVGLDDGFDFQLAK